MFIAKKKQDLETDFCYMVYSISKNVCVISILKRMQLQEHLCFVYAKLCMH